MIEVVGSGGGRMESRCGGGRRYGQVEEEPGRRGKVRNGMKQEMEGMYFSLLVCTASSASTVLEEKCVAGVCSWSPVRNEVMSQACGVEECSVPGVSSTASQCSYIECLVMVGLINAKMARQ